MLYPLLFETNLHTLVWGTECWEASTVPSSVSIIANGPLAGKDLASVIAREGAAVLGEAVCNEYGGKMPLFVKFIQANRDLSIQVHPNDALAAERHNTFGKTEMWYIIDAEPGATLFSGFSHHISKEEYCRRVKDGTICDVLARHEVHPGDVFYIPAGRVHAIGGGITLAEVQQTSDVTYRIFDYNRPGLDGKPRQLHTEQALDAIDFSVSPHYKTFYGSTLNHAARVIDTPFFDVRIIDLHRQSFLRPSLKETLFSKDKKDSHPSSLSPHPSSFHRNLIKYDSFVISVCITGSCRLIIRPNENLLSGQEEIYLREGHACLIPACLADYDFIPCHPNTRILETHIDRKNRSLKSKILRALKIKKK